jgi:hypothetical protein
VRELDDPILPVTLLEDDAPVATVELSPLVIEFMGPVYSLEMDPEVEDPVIALLLDDVIPLLHVEVAVSVLIETDAEDGVEAELSDDVLVLCVIINMNLDFTSLGKTTNQLVEEPELLV